MPGGLGPDTLADEYARYPAEIDSASGRDPGYCGSSR